MRKAIYSLVIGVMLVPCALKAQKVIDYPPKIVVICLDADTRKPMGGVKVIIKRNDTIIKTFNTDGLGRCLILKPKVGKYSVVATKASYYAFSLAHVDVPGDQTVILEIPMDAQPDKQKKGSKMVAIQ